MRIEDRAAAKMRKKADMIKYTKDKVKLCSPDWSSYIDEFCKIAEDKSLKSNFKALLPLAALGFATGVFKGGLENKIMDPLVGRGMGRSMAKGLARGTTGAASTLLVGLAMAHLMSSKKKK